MRQYFFLTLLILAGGVPAAERLSDADALRILERIAKAPSVTTFQGVYLQRHGERIETIRVCHVVDGGILQEHRETLEGAPREMLRQGDQLGVFMPEGSPIHGVDLRSHDRLFPRLLQDNPAELLKHYLVRTSARERVAGVDADVLELEPRDRLRYPHRFWVHPDTGILLKAATYGFKGEQFDSYAFSQLVFGNQVDRSLLKPVHPLKPVPPALQAPPSTAWDVKGVPVGFRLMQQTQKKIQARTVPTIQHVYGDGLVTVSVFLETQHATHSMGAMRQGGVSAFRRQEGAYLITALGAVPPATVEQFAKAYKPSGKQVNP